MISFEQFLSYTRKILTQAIENKNTRGIVEDIHSIVNGAASEQLIKSVPRQTLQDEGVFFTGTKLADSVCSNIPTPPALLSAYDPTCGAGDLLLAYAKTLPTHKSAIRTIREWGKILHGTDLNSDFISTAKNRLALLALDRGCELDFGQEDIDNFFPHIRVKDGLQNNDSYQTTNYILINPPFTRCTSFFNEDWGGKNVSYAAVFLDKCLRYSNDGTTILAVLPDVLRSGSRYSHWRRFIEANSKTIKTELYGLFNHNVDVDVFISSLIKSKGDMSIKINPWHLDSLDNRSTISDYFEVCVGAVVPHRDQQTGQTVRYICAKTIPQWKNISKISHKRKFAGTVHTPPFVVIRRTSNPKDKHRCVPTIISKGSPVAVENHLIVLKPKDDSISTCIKLLKQLDTKAVNNWVNKRIRCRHLTVGAVKEIPIIISGAD